MGFEVTSSCAAFLTWNFGTHGNIVSINPYTNVRSKAFSSFPYTSNLRSGKMKKVVEELKG